MLGLNKLIKLIGFFLYIQCLRTDNPHSLQKHEMVWSTFPELFTNSAPSSLAVEKNEIMQSEKKSKARTREKVKCKTTTESERQSNY